MMSARPFKQSNHVLEQGKTQQRNSHYRYTTNTELSCPVVLCEELVCDVKPLTNLNIRDKPFQERLGRGVITVFASIVR